MGDSILLWCSAALLLFWAMGAYNRLMRLRSQSIAAFMVLDGFFNQYLLLVKTNDLQRVPLNDTVALPTEFIAAWSGLFAAADQFNASLRVTRQRPLHGVTMNAFRTAFDTLCMSWERVGEVSGLNDSSLLTNTMRTQWVTISYPLETARAEFNQRISDYNDAINQFPALLLAWIFGFKAAQPL